MSLAVKAGTVDILWTFNIVNPDGSIANLSGYTANFIVSKDAQTQVFNHSANVSSYSQVTYTLQAGDFTTPGVFYGSIQLINGPVVEYTNPPVVIGVTS